MKAILEHLMPVLSDEKPFEKMTTEQKCKKLWGLFKEDKITLEQLNDGCIEITIELMKDGTYIDEVTDKVRIKDDLREIKNYQARKRGEKVLSKGEEYMQSLGKRMAQKRALQLGPAIHKNIDKEKSSVEEVRKDIYE